MEITKEAFLKSLVYLLRETFEGSPVEGSAYLDRGVGFLNTVAEIDADGASADFFGTTVAAQTEHAKFYLDRLCEFINGRTEKVNWDHSWLIEDVDRTEWDALRDGVRSSYEKTMQCLAGVDEWSEKQVGLGLGILAHTAYHLGSIRQIAKTKHHVNTESAGS
jgi:hypothetical protein